MRGTILGCERGDQIQKYGSYDACMKARESKRSKSIFSKDNVNNLNKELDKQPNKELVKQQTKAPKGFGDPIKDKKWILYVVLAVAGYFAYKKFKK